jgi:hypothetical protein
MVGQPFVQFCAAPTGMKATKLMRFPRTSEPMMNGRSVRGAVCRASGRDCRIILFGKDRTIVPLSDFGLDKMPLSHGDDKGRIANGKKLTWFSAEADLTLRLGLLL